MPKSAEFFELFKAPQNLADKSSFEEKASFQSKGITIRISTLILGIIMFILLTILAYIAGYKKAKEEIQEPVNKIKIQEIPPTKNNILLLKKKDNKKGRTSTVTSKKIQRKWFGIEVLAYKNNKKGKESSKKLVFFLIKKGFRAYTYEDKNRIKVVVGKFQSKRDKNLLFLLDKIRKLKIKGKNYFKHAGIIEIKK